MLELGRSEHWSVALALLTNQKKVSAKPIFKYFEPLINWLKIENSKYPDETIGWSY
jgi:peptidyl-dipeptidase A